MQIDAWRAGDPRLAPEQGKDVAIQWVEAYQPADPAQQMQRNQILDACRRCDDILLRSCFPGHLTASALVIDDRCEKVLLHHHAKLKRWLQFGGHCDGDGNLAHAAWRECQEESGIDELFIFPQVIDVDIHEIPAIEEEPAHDHLDIRFLVMTSGNNQPVVSRESRDVRWFGLSELNQLDTDESVLRLVELVKNKSTALRFDFE